MTRAAVMSLWGEYIGSRLQRFSLLNVTDIVYIKFRIVSWLVIWLLF